MICKLYGCCIYQTITLWNLMWFRPQYHPVLYLGKANEESNHLQLWSQISLCQWDLLCTKGILVFQKPNNPLSVNPPSWYCCCLLPLSLSWQHYSGKHCWCLSHWLLLIGCWGPLNSNPCPQHPFPLQAHKHLFWSTRFIQTLIFLISFNKLWH